MFNESNIPIRTFINHQYFVFCDIVLYIPYNIMSLFVVRDFYNDMVRTLQSNITAMPTMAFQVRHIRIRDVFQLFKLLLVL
jgi:hypothetical protein